MNNAIQKQLKERWKRTISLLAAQSSQDLVTGAFQEVCQHYSENHRHYHTLSHIDRCLHLFDKVSTETKDPLSLELALWLHDLIYDTNSADNEERSAEFASYLLNKLTLPQNITERVRELILATKHDGRESGRETAGPGDTADPDPSYIRDIDLSILGAPPSEYKDYIEAVRKEYVQYSEKQFNKGRVTFLRQFLAKDRIYKTGYFFSRYEDRARYNLSRELQIRSPSDTGTSRNQKL